MQHRIFGLDFIRVLMVYAVVFHHTEWFGLPIYPELFQQPAFALIGVEILFTLSGYLVGGIFLSSLQKGTLTEFKHLLPLYQRRWLRTLPLYYLFYLFTLLSALPWQNPWATWPYLFFLQNFTSLNLFFYLHSWTLAILEIFYILFPLFLVLAYKLFKNAQGALWATCGFFLLFPFLCKLALVSAHPYLFDLRMILIYRLDAPVWGIVVAWVQSHYPSLWNLGVRSVILPLSLLAAILLYSLEGYPLLSESKILSCLFFPLLSLGTAGLLPFLASWKTVSFKPLALVTAYLSQIGYSIYLCHPLALCVCIGIFRAFLHDPTPLEFTFIAVIGVTLSSIGVYHILEAPFARLRPPRPGKTHPLSTPKEKPVSPLGFKPSLASDKVPL